MRVLAVTTNASLVVALGSMMREWEVIAVRDVERAAAEGSGSVVALIDLGETDAGIAMADQLFHHGITIPCVVLGDVDAHDIRASVLVRPFSLEELGVAVREAATRPARAATPAASVAAPPAPEPLIEDVEQVRKPDAQGNGSAFVGTEELPGPPLDVAAEAEQILEELTTQAQASEPEPEPEPRREPEAVDVERVAAPEPAWEAAPEPEPEPAPAEPAAWSEPSTSEATRSVWHEPVPSGVTAEPASRWKLRRRAGRAAPSTTPETEAPLVRRLRIAAAHARELEDLVTQLPFLADLGAMAEGLISEIDRQFVCEITSVSVRREEGYVVVAHRGLSRVEAGMVIPETQSLFSDVLKTAEGILIQPIDLAQGLVAGIGGARTEAMMVAPALVNDECVAVVVVGGDQFTELDLDRLSDLAAEAAPGLAVAQLLDRLGGTPSY